MKRTRIYIIITLTALSLTGIVFTQLFWMKKAFDLKQEQFNNNVKIALKSVVNQLMEHNRAQQGCKMGCCESFCHLDSNNIKSIVTPEILDSLIRNEMHYYNVKSYFEYGIFDKKNDSLLFGQHDFHDAEVLKSTLNTPLTCLWKKNAYVLSVYFPKSNENIFHEMGIWLMFSMLLILITIACFAITIVSFIKQKKLGEMKSDFINNMTHEFKTPISTISLSSEMLMSNEMAITKEKVQQYAHVIYEENTRLRNQVDKILQTAGMEKDSYQLNRTTFDIHPIIQDIIKNCPAQFNECKTTFNVKLDAPQSTIFADIIHIGNVFSNLIDNAVKYGKQDSQVCIQTYNKGDKLFIKVKDNGIGISKENIKHIFKQFYRVSTGNRHDIKGFGIGLFYVKRILELHNANIKAESVVGKGTTFIISFNV